MAWGCEHPSQNHSDDIIEVWHGEPEPFILCGFHASQLGPQMYVILREARLARANTPLDAIPDEPEYPAGWDS
jgi:hypothetical protein